jgi:hypothetical protein
LITIDIVVPVRLKSQAGCKGQGNFGKPDIKTAWKSILLGRAVWELIGWEVEDGASSGLVSLRG